MTTPPTPERHPWYEDALRIFMEGKWEQLGITDDRDLRLRDRVRAYIDAGRTVPSHLLYWTRAVWELHRARILADWERKLEESESDPDFYTCSTCPNCGCPGME